MKKVSITIVVIMLFYFVQAVILDTHVAFFTKGKGVYSCLGIDLQEQRRCVGIISHYYE
ncbi:MAG: hypothetical protein KBD24_03825 [Candidatus Pacebacteria bacterium]|nr:hypothetical protein [Candidatus Paceibacterota bacterium]